VGVACAIAPKPAKIKFMKTDSLFYQLFQTLPSVFFELIGHPLTEANGYEFHSVEIQDTGKGFDGVFVPAKRNRQPIYFINWQTEFDENFYYRFFTEIFLYLGQNKSNRDWFAAAIFQRRIIEPIVPRPYQRLVESSHIKRIYLDELEQEAANRSPLLGMLKLLLEDEATAKKRGQYLVKQLELQAPETIEPKIWEFLPKILAYKFPHLGNQELGEMFELTDLKQTKLYQEAKTEGKLSTVPLLLELGLTVERIAQELNLNLSDVKQAAQELAGQSTTLE